MFTDLAAASHADTSTSPARSSLLHSCPEFWLCDYSVALDHVLWLSYVQWSDSLMSLVAPILRVFHRSAAWDRGYSGSYVASNTGRIELLFEFSLGL